MTKAVVLDIEGTTSATSYVVSTLFPYARARYAVYLDEHRSEATTNELLDETRHVLDEHDADERRVVDAFISWTDADAKIAPLKTLQGWIWQEGFARGELRAPFFPDVVPAMRRWRGAGLGIAVYSSGSVDAQRAWFGHSVEGSLLDLVDAYFDTRTAGPKREVDSYRSIANALGVTAPDLLFLSDSGAELDAASAAGWRTIGVVREGEPAYDTGVGDHASITSFAALDIASTLPT